MTDVASGERTRRRTPARVAPPPGRAWSGSRVRIVHREHGRPRVERVWAGGHPGQPLRAAAVLRRRFPLLMALGSGAVSALFLPAVLVGVLVLTGTGDRVAMAVVAGVFVVAATVAAARTYRPLTERGVHAGDRVLAAVDGTGVGPWVDMYRLGEIELTGSSSTPTLRLRDLEGRHVRLPCGLVAANPELWIAIRHGIAHSLDHGATADAHTRRRLTMPAT